MTTKNYLVYKIVDPETGNPFYVGQTANIKERINQHMCNKKGALGDKIQSIRKSDLKPLFVIIAQCDYKSVGRTEKYWIAKLKQEGHTLCNAERKNALKYDLVFDIELEI